MQECHCLTLNCGASPLMEVGVAVLREMVALRFLSNIHMSAQDYPATDSQH